MPVGVDVTPTAMLIDYPDSPPGSRNVSCDNHTANLSLKVGAFPIAEIMTNQTTPTDYAVPGGFLPAPTPSPRAPLAAAAGDVMVEIYEIGP